MIKTIATLALSFGIIGSASATEGFAPWNDRVAETAYTINDTRADNGFAPWEARSVEAEVSVDDVQTVASDAVFRPWADAAS